METGMWRLLIFAFVISLLKASTIEEEPIKNSAEDENKDSTESLTPSPLVTRFAKRVLKLGKDQLFKKELPKIDLLVILDASHTIGVTAFLEARTFVQNLLHHFSISPGTTRVAVMCASSAITLPIDFKRCKNRECLMKAIKNVKYDNSPSNMHHALTEAQKIFQDAKNYRKDTKKITLILSDGNWKTEEEPLSAAVDLRSKYEATVIVIDLSPEKSNENLKKIASAPKSYYYYHVGGANVLRSLTGEGTGVERFTECQEAGELVLDECHRRCKCVNGRLENCQRVRWEFTSMDKAFRAHYLNVYKTLTTEEPYKSRYNSFAAIHSALFEGIAKWNPRLHEWVWYGIHTEFQFLPWHRWYIVEFENLLKEVDCRVTLPYWDWSAWAHDPWNTTVFWSDEDYGLGNGLDADKCVTNGLFNKDEWQLHSGECLERNFSGSLPDKARVREITEMRRFRRFELALRSEIHNTMHISIGGTMNSVKSASAPEFFLHHAFIDKIWSDWQMSFPEQKNTYYPEIDNWLGSMNGSNYRRAQFLNLENHPECVHVTYEYPTVNNARNIDFMLKAFSKKSLATLERVEFPKIPEEAFDLFKVPKEKRKEARRIESELGGTFVPSSELQLSGVNKTIGFSLPAFTDDEDAIVFPKI